MEGDRARVVVVGGGITGCSVAYHLAKAGWTDVVLLEKGELTSGSTCHAAGLVTQFNPSPTMMRFRRYSVELYEELGVFERLGSLRIASSKESLMELRRGASRARGIGLDVDVVGPKQALALMPQASAESLHGAVWVGEDGCVDPHTATYALADAARGLGVEIRTRTQVTGIRLGPNREVTGVETTAGPIETEAVVNACGIWAPAGGGDGRRVHAVGAGRPPAHRARGGGRPRAPARHAVLPRHRQPGLRPLGGGRRALRWVRARPGGPLGGRRPLGARRPRAPTRTTSASPSSWRGPCAGSRSSRTPASSRSSATPTR